jgi:hypothetical protein
MLRRPSKILGPVMTDAEITKGSSFEKARPFATALQRAISDFKAVAALFGAFLSVIFAYFALQKGIDLPQPWLTIVSVVPLVIFAIFYLLPEWRDAAARKSLEELGVRGRLKDPGYFRLTPYTEREQTKFIRPDNADTSAIDWISSSKSTVLYLYGQSGVGKSSLLSAAAIPALRKQEVSWIAVDIRLREDPLKAIETALLTPEVVWQSPPRLAFDDVINLIERAEKYARDHRKRLLLVMDQFEEIFILSNDDQKKKLATLFSQLVERAPAGLRILVSLRAEYLSDLPALQLPPPTLGYNCFEVRPFTQAAARDFLEKSQLEIGPLLLKKVLAEAAEIEDMPDRVRPVVLNMIGLVLAAFKGTLPKGITPGRLLSGYVYRTMSASDIRAHAPVILRHLVTDVGTKRARTLTEIAELSNITNDMTRGCLLRLADGGLVRAVDHERWEISHDFVARLIQPIVQNWRKTAWEIARPWLAPTALIAWLGIVAIIILSVPILKDSIAIRVLTDGGLIPNGRNRYVAADTLLRAGDEQHLHSLLPYLSWLKSPAYLTIELDEYSNQNLITGFAGWPELPNLYGLSLRTSRMKSFSGMPIFPNLQSFSFNGFGFNNVSGMPIQPALTFFSLGGGGNFNGMPALPQLTRLELEDGTDLSDMVKQPNLREMVLNLPFGSYHFPEWIQLDAVETGIASQADILALPKVAPKLRKATFFVAPRDGAPLDLSSLKSQDALQELSLFGRLDNLKFLSALKNLTVLHLSIDRDRFRLVFRRAEDNQLYGETDLRGGVAVDFDSIAALKSDVKVTLEMYEGQAEIPSELKPRIDVDYLPDKF